MKKSKGLLARAAAVLMAAAVLTQTLAIHAAAETSVEPKSSGTVYYVDSASGSDENDGTSESTPWQSLEKVNETVFQPGDQILFKTGSRYEGQLAPQGSGEEGAPIVIDMYGEGEEKPVIDGMGREGDRTILDNDGAVVVLHNQDYWEINNLEVTNKSEKMGERFGILVRWHDYGTGQHVYVRDCYVHDISGMYQNGVTEYEEDGSVVNKNRFLGDGIMVVATGTPESEGGVPTNYNDILIEGNRLEEIYRTAITIWSQWTDRPGAPLYYPGADGKKTFHSTVGRYVANTNVVIRGNSMDLIAGDGILINTCDGALVEYNDVSRTSYYSVGDANAGVWPHNSDNTVMQYNEVYETGFRGADGQSFDVDLNCYNTTIQYNYSHDNEGGFLLLMPNAYNVVIRYNISENDQMGVFHWIGQNVSAYNNTFYLTGPLYRGTGGSGSLYNNIFYAKTPGTSFDWSNLGYSNNCYYNFASLPNDSNAVVGDPKLTEAGSGSDEGYRLSEDSICVNGGLLMENNGGVDYFGNALDDVPDIGASDTISAGEARYEMNYALGCPVTVSSTIDSWGWNSQYLTDGIRAADGARGWTSVDCTGRPEGVNTPQWAEIDLDRVVPMNKLVLTNSSGGFPVDFTVSVYTEEGEWQEVVSVTDCEHYKTADGTPLVFGFDEVIYGSKVRIDVSKMTQKSDGIYAQIGEVEVCCLDKTSLQEMIAYAEADPELAEAIAEELAEAKAVCEKPIEELTYSMLNYQENRLKELVLAYEQDQDRFMLMMTISDMEKILKAANGWKAAEEEFENAIEAAKAVQGNMDASAEMIHQAIADLETALEKFNADKDYMYTSITDDFDNWDYVYRKGSTMFWEGAYANNGDRNSVFSNPASSTENYLIYRVNDLKSFSFYYARIAGGIIPATVYTSPDNITYTELTDLTTENITEGEKQVPKTIYSCDSLPEGTNYLKIKLPDGYTWEYSIQHVVLNGTQELKELLVQAPEKLSYTQGEELDLTGMEVTAKYIDTTEQAVAAENCQITGYDPETLGTQTVTVSYSENGVTKTAAFTVTVKASAVDKGNLEYLLNKAYEAEENGELENVVESAVKAFHEAVANGEAVMADEDAAEEEVFDACWNLLQALGGLGIYQGDKGLLEQAVALAEKLDLTLYVEAGQEEFLDAWNEAKEVLESGDATQDAVDEARIALLDAMAALRMKADKSALEALLNQVEAMDLSVYTAESVQMFKAVLDEAKMVMEDLTLSEDDQQVVDEAVDKLKKAYEALEEKTSSTEEETNQDAQENESGSNAETGDSAAGVVLAGLLMMTAVVWFLRRRIAV